MVFPGTLLELWRVLNACVNADKIILMQAANTGLTEGSTPNGNDYDRDIVIISTLRLDKLHLLDKGEQVLAYPGTTLYSLEKALKPLVANRTRSLVHLASGHRWSAGSATTPAARWYSAARRTPKCRCTRKLMKTAS